MDTKLWEFSLYFPRELLCYFENLKNALKARLYDKKNCVSIFPSQNYYCLMMAMDREEYNKNITFIKEKIADIILVFYKPKTIMQSISNFNLKEHENVILLDILSSFDIWEDKETIIKNLSLCDRLYIESFVMFKLAFLVKNWKETSELINQNSLFMLDSGIKKELMQFLMAGLNTSLDKIKIENVQNSLKIDTDINLLPLYYAKYDYDNLLFALISKFPKQIEIVNYKAFDAKFISNLYDLFGTKLKLVE